MANKTKNEMLFNAALVVAACLTPAQNVWAQAKSTMRIVKEEARVGELDRGSCFVNIGGSHALGEGDRIVVVGAQPCKRYSGREENFYQVAYRGELGYVKASSVFIAPEKVQLLMEVAPGEQERVAEMGKEDSKTLHEVQLRAAIDAVDKTTPKGIALLTYGLHDVSEYTEGTGFSFRVANSTKKTIKYVTATIVGLNSVKDPVRTLRGSTQVTLRGVGPIDPNEDASYSWDYFWHSDLPEFVRWVSLKVDYMDGTSRLISRVQDVLLEPRHYRMIYER